MEQEGIGTSNGSYWLGELLSLVDIAFYPWFERWAVLEHYRAFVPSTCTRLKQWYSTMLTRELVQAIKNSAEFYIQQYIKYANSTASVSLSRKCGSFKRKQQLEYFHVSSIC